MVSTDESGSWFVPEESGKRSVPDDESGLWLVPDNESSS